MENRLTKFMFDRAGIPAYQKFLDLASLRHKLVSGNVANASTAGYRAKDINFKKEFERVSQSGQSQRVHMTHPNHIPTSTHPDRPAKIESTKPKIEELNSVDIDQEISKMAQNELLYSVGARLVQRKLEGRREVITSR